MDTYRDHRTRRDVVRQSHLFWVFLLLASMIGGTVSALFLPPVLMIGLVAVMVSVVVIMRYPYVGLLIYLAIFMLRPGELYPALESLRMERIVGILVLVATIIRHKRVNGYLFIPSDTGTKLLFAFFGIMCASWVTSYDGVETRMILEQFIKLLVFYVIIVYELDTKEKFNFFLGAFVVLIGVIAFLSFRDYYGGGAIYRMGIQRAIGRTSAGGDANSLAGTLATTVPLAVAFLRYHRNLLVRLFTVGIIGLLLLMIVNTGSRSGLLTLIVVTGAIVWFSRYRAISTMIAGVVFVASWFVIPDQYQARYTTMFDEGRNADDISSGRIAIWENGLRMAVKRPVLGVGAGAFRAANRSGAFGPSKDMQAHNLYIQLFATVGVVGAVIWLWFLIRMLKQLFRPRPPSTDEDEKTSDEAWDSNRWFDLMRQGIVGTLAGLMVSGMFGHSLYRYTWYLAAALTLTLVTIYYKNIHKDDETDEEDESEIEPAVET